MAVWKLKCGGAVIRILDADHLPPHCHVSWGGRSIKVTLHTLGVRPGVQLPHGVWRCLRDNQDQMLEAWDRVKVVPPGGRWEFEG